MRHIKQAWVFGLQVLMEQVHALASVVVGESAIVQVAHVVAPLAPNADHCFMALRRGHRLKRKA